MEVESKVLEARNAECEGQIETRQDAFARNTELTKKVDAREKKITDLEIKESGHKSEK